MRGRLTTVDAAIEAIKARTAALEQAAFQTASANRATFFTFPENAFCGELTMVRDPDDASGPLVPSWTYPGSNTVPLSWRTPIAAVLNQEAVRISNARGESTTIVLPTTYDTGVTTPEGRKLAINSSIVATGPGDTYFVEKPMATAADGMGAFLVKTANPDAALALVRLPDMFGDGKGMAVGIKTCVQLAISSPYRLENELRLPDMIVASSYGVPPPSMWKDQSIILLNENAGPLLNQDIREMTGAWQPSVSIPQLSAMQRLLGPGSALAKFFGASYQYNTVTPQRLRQITYSRIGAVRYCEAVINGETFPMYETPTVPVPATLNEGRLDAVISDVMSTKISAMDTAGATYTDDPVAEPFGPEKDSTEPGIEPADAREK